ncbi:Protein NRT1/ PTR FAMILY 1.2 [Camellia lanceoleosa]|nr:Protein NRT1/ PTR FAMILY 1.2 [Camellia lanceoleosa]
MAIEEGLADDPNAIVDMSAMWLIPQFALLGAGDAFNSSGQVEFYMTRFSKSMSSIAVALYTFGMAMAALVGSVLVSTVDNVTSSGGKISWLSKNINKGHVDYYYWLITILGLVNFVYFLICCRVFYNEPLKDENERTAFSEDNR